MKKVDDDIRFGTGGGGTTGRDGPMTGRHGGDRHRDRDLTGTKGHTNDTATDERYKEINARLRRLLSEERKALQSIRSNYAIELRSRTEMEMLLRQCVDDVRKEISMKTFVNPVGRAGSRPGSSGAILSLGPSSSSFAQADRERTLELLLSQERVISLIYAKTFPINQTGKKNAASSGTSLDITTSQAEMGSVDAEILHAISMGLSSNASAYSKARDEEYENDGLSVSEGGGGPLIAAALSDGGDDNGTRLPAI